MKVVQDKITRN